MLTCREKRCMHGTWVLSFLLSRQKEGLCHACEAYRSAGIESLLERIARQARGGAAALGGGSVAGRGAESVIDRIGSGRYDRTAPSRQECGSAAGQWWCTGSANQYLWRVGASVAVRIAPGAAGGGLVGPDPGSALALAARQCGGERSQRDAL